MLQLPLSLPQRLDPGASPRFAGMNLSGLAAAGLLAASLTGQLQAAESADVIAALGYTPTNAAVIPTGAPAAGQMLVGNAGGTAYARKTLTGDVTVDSNGVTAIGAARVVNSMLLNPALTISGHSVALGASLALAQADVSGLTTASSPTFAGATLSALANAGILAAGTGGALRAATISDISFAAQANGLATLGGDGKLTGSQLPAIAITDTFVVNSQAAMLALTAQTGDIAIRTDISTTFVLSGTDPSILGNWTQVLFNAPVTSVAGRTGAVTLANTDVGLAFVTNDAQTKASVVPNTLPSAAQILIGNAGGTAFAPKSVSGDGGIIATGVLTVTKLNGVSPGPFFDGNNANLLSGTLQAAQFPALTGDVTSSAGSLATSIAAGAVTLAKLANLPGDTFIGNATGSSAVPTALNSGQATALLATFVGDAGAGGTKGLVPAPGAGDAAAFKYLAADGTWKGLAVPVTGVTVGTTLVSGGTPTRILYDNAGTLGEYTAAGAKSFLSIAYADVSGLGTAAQAALTATDKQVAFNSAGALAGSALFTFDPTAGVKYPMQIGNGLGAVTNFVSNFLKASHLYTNPADVANPTYHQAALINSSANFAFTADTTFTNKAIYALATIDAANTGNWTRTGYPGLVGVESSVLAGFGSSGTVNIAAAFAAFLLGSGASGATFDQAVGLWVDPGGSGFNYYLGTKITGLEHGTNNTGIYLGIDQFAIPATGNWGFYDCTGYKSHFGGDVEIVGNVTTGAWHGTKIGLAYGGTNADLSATGGTSQVLKQTSMGGAVTVAQLAAGDISGLAASATTDTTNAANISSGTLPNARLVSVPNSSLANSSVTIGATAIALGASATAIQGIATLYPSADSTTAMQIKKADNATVVASWDTTNVGLNIGNSIQTNTAVKLGLYTTGGNCNLAVTADNNGAANATFGSYRAGTAGGAITFQHYRGTVASPVTVNANDFAGQFDFGAYDGTQVNVVARLQAKVTAVGGSNNISGALIALTRNGASALAEAGRFTELGGLNIGAYSTDPGAGNLKVENAVTIGAGSAISSSGPGGALTALGFTAPGTGVATALGVNIGTAGAVLVNGGALGTPSSGVATNLTGTAAGLTAGACSAGWHTLKQVNVEQTVVTGTTAKTNSYSFTVPGGTLGANGRLRVSTIFRFTGANNNRLVGLDFGGTTFWQSATIGNTTFSISPSPLVIANRNSTSVQISGNVNINNVGSGIAVSDITTGSINTAADQAIELWVTLTSGSDTGAVESVLVEYNNDAP